MIMNLANFDWETNKDFFYLEKNDFIKTVNG
jgi:hypothetical protein